MRHPVKVPAALGVLTAGVGAACLFLKAPAETQPLGIELKPLVRVAEADRQPLMELSAVRKSSAVSLDKTFAAGAAAVDAAAASHPQATPFETTVPPAWPRLAREYPRSGEIASKIPDAAPPLRPTMHTVVDGDTLAKLARRYLGSAERQGELFEANRQLLVDPELLPIGAVLRIPSSGAQP